MTDVVTQEDDATRCPPAIYNNANYLAELRLWVAFKALARFKQINFGLDRYSLHNKASDIDNLSDLKLQVAL